MKHSFLSIPVLFTAILFAVFTQSSCKENTLINSKISPSDSTVSVYDTTLPCITHSFYNDTVMTSTNISGIPMYQAVGAITDPFFGTMTGATFFNLVPNNLTATIFDNAVIDSAVLVVPYGGFTYGDSANTNLTQSYQVFYMQDSIGYNSIYYSYSDKPLNPVPLSAPVTVNLHKLNDSVAIKGINVTPGLLIKLNLDALKSRLLPAVSAMAGSTTPATSFLNAFNGICLKVADSRQSTTAIPYLRLDNSTISSSAQIAVYYHHTTVTVPDTVVEQYYFSPTYCSHFNKVSKSFARYPAEKIFHSTEANDSLIVLQNNPGGNLSIIVPGIKHLPAGIITKAELLLSVLPGSNNPANFFIPSRLYPYGIANSTYPVGYAAGASYQVADRYPVTSLSPFEILDGQSHQITTGSTAVPTYRIGIPREVMASIAAKNDTIHLQITGSQDYYGAYHLVAGGGNYPDPLYRAKLKVVYSTLKQ